MEDAVNFDPVEIIYQAQAGQIAVHIVGEVVEMLWDGDGGPQTGPEIVELHRPAIYAAIQMKLANAMTAPTDITLTKDDFDPGA